MLSHVYSKYVTWEREGTRQTKQQKNDIEMRVSHKALKISQRAAKKAHPRKSLPVCI